jgi:hypothetical protein
MARVHGRKAFFSITNVSAVVKDLSAFCNNVDFPTQVDQAEVSGFGDADKSYVVGLRGHSIKVGGNWDGANDGPDDVFGNLAGQGAAGTIVSTFVYGPAGSGSGSVKYSGSCLVTAFGVTSPIGGAVTFSADMMISGSVTRGTF